MVLCGTLKSPGLSQYSLVWGAVSLVMGQWVQPSIVELAEGSEADGLMPYSPLWVSIGPVL